MCFSASASFTAGAFLVPIGAYAVASAISLKRYHYILLALVPFFFGIQQIIEGGVWLSYDTNAKENLHLFSLGFVFFSHFFWPFWIPISVYIIMRNHTCTRAWVTLFLAVVGCILGVVSYIPFLLNPESIQVALCASSIQYSYQTVLDALIGTNIGKYVYIAIIILPLWICRDWAVKIMGVLVLLSVIASYLFYSYAFNSVWCFFSAVISMYVVYIIRRKKDFGCNYTIKKQK